jgi:hypothetical protein
MHRLAGDPACEPETIDSGRLAVQDKFPDTPATLHAFIVPRGGIEMPHAFAYSLPFKEFGHLRNAANEEYGPIVDVATSMSEEAGEGEPPPLLRVA